MPEAGFITKYFLKDFSSQERFDRGTSFSSFELKINF